MSADADGLDDLRRRVAELETEVRDLRTLVGTPAGVPTMTSGPATSPSRVAHPDVTGPLAGLPSTSLRVDDVEIADHTLEEQLGRHALAIVGGAAVLVGIIFFVALAIRRGLIPVPVRMALAAVGCIGLVAGADALNRRGSDRTLVGTLATVGIVGLFATLIATIGHYELLAAAAAIPLTATVGALGLVAAHRLKLTHLSDLGGIGIMIGPLAGGLPSASGASLAYGLAASAVLATLAVRVPWRRLWPISVLLGSLIVALWIDWGLAADGLRTGRASTVVVLAALICAHLVVAAVGHSRWRGASSLSPFTTTVLTGAVLLTTWQGVAFLQGLPESPTTGRNIWVSGVAAGLVVAGLVGIARHRDTALGRFVVALGFALAAIAVALWLDGPGLVVGWAAQGIVAGWVARRSRDDRALWGAFATLAAAAVATLDPAPPTGLASRITHPWTGVACVFVVAAAVALVAVLVRELPERTVHLGGHRVATLGCVACVASLYGGSMALVQTLGPDRQSTQVALSSTWAVVGLALIVAGLVRDRGGLYASRGSACSGWHSGSWCCSTSPSSTRSAAHCRSSSSACWRWRAPMHTSASAVTSSASRAAPAVPPHRSGRHRHLRGAVRNPHEIVPLARTGGP